MVCCLHFWSISEGLRVNFRKPANFTTVKSLKGKVLLVPVSSEVTLLSSCRDEQCWVPVTTHILDYMGEFRGSKVVEYEASRKKPKQNNKKWSWIKLALKCSVLFWHGWLCASVSHTTDVRTPVLTSWVLSAGLFDFNIWFGWKTKVRAHVLYSVFNQIFVTRIRKEKIGINTRSISGMFGSMQLLSVKIVCNM